MDGGRVALHRLTFVEDGDHVLVGRPDIESFAVFPVDGAEFLRRLRSGVPVAEAASWYERTYGESLDVADFLETLADLGFLRRAGEPPAPADVGEHAEDPDPSAGPGGRPGLRSLGRAIFSPVAWLLYAALWAGATAVLVGVPAVRPVPSSLFFTGSLVAMQLVLLVAELPLIFLHEAYHVLAGRRIGLDSRLGIGRRLYFVVFQTTMTGLFGVSPRRRYLPLLAGMVADAVVFSALVLAAAGDHAADGSLSIAGRLALALAYLTALRVAWQFLVVMETDVQHVLATALRCAGLGQMARGYLWAGMRRLGGRDRADTEQPFYSPRERAVLRWFAPLTVVGVVALLGLAVVNAGPILSGLASRIGHGLAGGAGPAGVLDAAASLVLLIAQFGVVGVLLLRTPLSRARRAVRSRRHPEAERSAAS